MKDYPITREIIEAASDRIRSYIHQTPVLTSNALNHITGNQLFFKCENFQKTGAFKMRGATNAILSLNEAERQQGVATHSSGNHAQAVAFAAKTLNLSAYVVMPETSSRVKVEAVKDYDAEVYFCKPNLQARENALKSVVEKTGARFIPPYDDYSIIAGQATASLELLNVVPDLNLILAPVGGGGLLSGTALASHFFGNNTSVIGCEPEGADDAFRSFHSDRIIPSVNPNTIADGLLTSLGEKNYQIIKSYVSQIWLANDTEIIDAMILVWERMKILIEPSSAVPLAALIRNKGSMVDRKIGIIISGGNYDVGKLLK